MVIKLVPAAGRLKQRIEFPDKADLIFQLAFLKIEDMVNAHRNIFRSHQQLVQEPEGAEHGQIVAAIVYINADILALGRKRAGDMPCKGLRGMDCFHGRNVIKKNDFLFRRRRVGIVFILEPAHDKPVHAVHIKSAQRGRIEGKRVTPVEAFAFIMGQLQHIRTPRGKGRRQLLCAAKHAVKGGFTHTAGLSKPLERVAAFLDFLMKKVAAVVQAKVSFPNIGACWKQGICLNLMIFD